MNLQPNETAILTSDNNKVVLTNLRISGDFKEWGYSHRIFIYLKDISSIQLIYRSAILLIVFAVVSGLFGLWASSQRYMEQQGSVGIIVGVVCFLLWWVTRRRVIAIYPDGGKPLLVSANMMKEQAINDFLEKVQLAKSERIWMLNKL